MDVLPSRRATLQTIVEGVPITTDQHSHHHHGRDVYAPGVGHWASGLPSVETAVVSPPLRFRNSGLRRLIEDRRIQRRQRQEAARRSVRISSADDDLSGSRTLRSLRLRARRFRSDNLAIHSKVMQNKLINGPTHACWTDGSPFEVLIELRDSSMHPRSDLPPQQSTDDEDHVFEYMGDAPTAATKPLVISSGTNKSPASNSSPWCTRLVHCGQKALQSTSSVQSLHNVQFLITIHAHSGNGIIAALSGDRGLPIDVFPAKSWSKMPIGVLSLKHTADSTKRGSGNFAVVFVHRHGAVCVLAINISEAVSELKHHILITSATNCKVPQSAIRFHCLFDSRRQPVIFDRKSNCIAAASLVRKRTSGVTSFWRTRSASSLNTLKRAQARFLDLAATWPAEQFLSLYGCEKYGLVQK